MYKIYRCILRDDANLSLKLYFLIILLINLIVIIIDLSIRVYPVIGEVRKVTDQYAVHQRRVAHQQQRRAHLAHADVPVTAELVVDPAEHAGLVFGAQRRAGYVAEQRHRGPHVRHAPVAPVAVRGRGPVVREGRERRQPPDRPHQLVASSNSSCNATDIVVVANRFGELYR